VLTARLIACFDVIDGRVTKARRFQDNIDVGDAGEIAATVYADGIDEVIFYDILASAQRRKPDLAMIEAVAARVFVPLTVGGGIRSLADMHDVLEAGAEKISLDSMAVRNPPIIAEGSREFGRQCIVQSMQVRRVPVTAEIPSGYEVMIDGARVATGLDAVAWARRGEELGAGEIVVNSIDQDGTHEGYELRRQPARDRVGWRRHGRPRRAGVHRRARLRRDHQLAAVLTKDGAHRVARRGQGRASQDPRPAGPPRRLTGSVA
jgi:cyclase